MNKRVIFNKSAADPFIDELREEVDRYFDTDNKSRYADWLLHLKNGAAALFNLFLYLTLLMGWFPMIPRLLIWGIFGISLVFVAMNMGHDALHGAYSKHPWVNRLLGFYAYDLIGISSYVWKKTHNLGHHVYTNIDGVDPDIDKPAVIRLSPHAPHYPFHRLQHWYIWLLYALMGVNWVFIGDYVCVWKDRKQISAKELFPFIGLKFLNIMYLIGIPILISPMPWWQVITGYLIAQMVAGIMLSVIFQLAHVVENVSFPLPDSKGMIEQPWARHEMETTSNFSCGNPFATHFVGGLNHQVEHHLFPQVSHAHYIDIEKILRRVCEKHQVSYHEYPTFWKALKSHARTLKRHGRNS